LFLLAARNPEFNWALERNLFGDNKLVQSMRGLFDNEHSYKVPYFEKDEIKGFIQKYQEFRNQSTKNNSLEQNAEEIFEDTIEGHPIMVRFAVLNQGLSGHVEQLYAEHLQDKDNDNYPHLKRVKTVILNSLFDISNIPLKDKMLEELGLLSTAKKELRNALIRKKGEFWEFLISLVLWPGCDWEKGANG
jgi:hypothetical protein